MLNIKNQYITFVASVFLRLIIYSWLLYIGFIVYGSFYKPNWHVLYSLLFLIFLLSIAFSVSKKDVHFCFKIVCNKYTRFALTILAIGFWILVLIFCYYDSYGIYDLDRLVNKFKYTYQIMLIIFSLPGSLLTSIIEIFLILIGGYAVFESDGYIISVNDVTIQIFLNWLYYFLIFLFQYYLLFRWISEKQKGKSRE